MTASSVLRAGRVALERLMVDTCRVTRPGGEPVYDPGTGQYVTPPPMVVYAGRCRVRQGDPRPTDAEVGGGQVALTVYTVVVPITVTGVESGDTVTVTASVLDPGLPGRVMVVTGVGGATHATARRLACEAQS